MLNIPQILDIELGHRGLPDPLQVSPWAGGIINLTNGIIRDDHNFTCAQANAKTAGGGPIYICIYSYTGWDSGGLLLNLLLLVALKLISDYLSGWAQLLSMGSSSFENTVSLPKVETNAHMPVTSEEALVLDGKWQDSSCQRSVLFLFLLFGG